MRHTKRYAGADRPRKKGQIEQLALALGVPDRPTRVELRSRTDPDQPMEGYEIYVRDEGSKETSLLGRTDYRGAITVPPGTGRLRTLFIRSGHHLMARLPIVPGVETVSVAPIPDDSLRLQVEGYLTNVQERLVDTIARREVLTARIHVRLDNGNVPGAVVLFDELMTLPTRDQFALQLENDQKKTSTKDAPMQAKIDKLFEETRKLLNKYLDPREVTKLRRTRQGAIAPEDGWRLVPFGASSRAAAGDCFVECSMTRCRLFGLLCSQRRQQIGAPRADPATSSSGVECGRRRRGAHCR